MTIREYDQHQAKFIVYSPISNIPENHICFLVNDLVENLDFDEIHSKYEGTAGNPAFNRKAFLKADLMGVLDGFFSSRKLEEQILVNDIYKFLVGDYTPDFRTICLIRKENKELYVKGLITLVATCKKLGITTFKHISTDGTYVKANASTKQLFSEKDLEMVNEIVNRRIEVDENEDLLYGDRNHLIVEKDYNDAINKIIGDDIQDIVEKIVIIDSETKKEEKEEENKANETNGSEEYCENLKILSQELLDLEGNKLKKISEKVKKLANKIIKGDENAEEKLKKAEEVFKTRDGKYVNMVDPDSFATKNKKKVFESLFNIQFSVDYDSKIILMTRIADSPTDHHQGIPMVDLLIDTYGLELIQGSNMSMDSLYGTGETLKNLEERGINAFIPNKYQASLEKNKEYGDLNKYHKYYFQYNCEKDYYLCPENQILGFKREYEKDGKRVYYNTKACKNCKSRQKCIKKRKTRIITAYSNEQAMQRMKLKMEKEENKEEYKKRTSVESVIGNIKHNLKFTEFSGRGNPYAEFETTKVSIGHNLKILHNQIKKIKNKNTQKSLTNNKNKTKNNRTHKQKNLSSILNTTSKFQENTSRNSKNLGFLPTSTNNFQKIQQHI